MAYMRIHKIALFCDSKLLALLHRLSGLLTLILYCIFLKANACCECMSFSDILTALKENDELLIALEITLQILNFFNILHATP